MQQANEWGHKDKYDFSKVKTSRESAIHFHQSSARSYWAKRQKYRPWERSNVSQQGRPCRRAPRRLAGQKVQSPGASSERMLHHKNQEADQKPQLFWNICRQNSDLNLVMVCLCLIAVGLIKLWIENLCHNGQKSQGTRGHNCLFSSRPPRYTHLHTSQTLVQLYYCLPRLRNLYNI